MKTNKLGKQLKIIIILQFPEMKVSKNMQANIKPYNLPIDTQKFNNNMPFPLYLFGVISAKTLVVMAIVNPYVKPQKKRANII